MGPDLAAEKERAARAAVAEIRPGMRIALGTGTTAAFAVRALAERFAHSSQISSVASSTGTEKLARELGVPVGPLASGDRFDLMIDGADEVTPSRGLTKGGGGALLREKLLARRSQRVLIIVDSSKSVGHHGERVPIPLETVPFARPVLLEELQGLGLTAVVRSLGGGRPLVSENGNDILDLHPTTAIVDAPRLDAELHALTGVVETGLFLGLASRVYVGRSDGTVEERSPAASGTPRGR